MSDAVQAPVHDAVAPAVDTMSVATVTASRHADTFFSTVDFDDARRCLTVEQARFRKRLAYASACPTICIPLACRA